MILRPIPDVAKKVSVSNAGLSGSSINKILRKIVRRLGKHKAGDGPVDFGSGVATTTTD
jgi:hypothetical protein